ncbi:MAG: branched-chain amino acid ABC transporter permease [Lachnospiraceae bacterium]|nr:branched-chain amino acid ABC transporter permease [Lachnospiraceae bacterium]
MGTGKKKKISETVKQLAITYGIVIVAYIVCEIFIHTGMMTNQLQGLLVPLCYYVVMAVSLNLTVGILGELSLGHAGFSCVGVFVSAVFSICMKDVITAPYLRLFLAILLGALAAGVLGLLIGIPVLRLRGDYLAIVTLAFGEIIKNVVNVIYLGKDANGLHISTKDTTSLAMETDGVVIIKGPQGISGMPSDANFTIGVILILLTLFIVLNLVHSRDGRAVMAIRDNLIAAESVGINITKYKLMAFSISAALAGAAGALYAHNFSIVKASTNNFGYNMSIMILVFVVLGGIGNIRGSVIAAVLLTLVPELLRGLQEYRLLIYSIILIGMMLFNWSPKAIAWKERVTARIKTKIHSKKKAEQA